MLARLEKSHPKSQIHIAWGVLVVLGIAMAGVFQGLGPYLPPCIFKSLTGVPCLTCGGTHCVVSLSRFDMMTSFMYNPLIFMGLIGLLLFSLLILMGLLFRYRLVIELALSEKRALRFSIIVLVLLDWAYLILRAKLHAG